MEFSLFSKEKVNRCKKKVIPWHVQKRYMESLSQLSLNQTISTAIYKKKIKSLQRNNRHLALALEQNQYLQTDKENLQIDNGNMLDIINCSRLKLMTMANYMKQATECLDETLNLLNSSINDSLSKLSPKNLMYRNAFKNKFQRIEEDRFEPILEVDESCTKKGKISRVDGCVSSSNKKCKLAKKEGKVKGNSKDVSKSTEESSSVESRAGSKDTNGKNSKKCGPAPYITFQNRRKSSPKSLNVESASSSILPTISSGHFYQTKNKRETLDKKHKNVKVILNDIVEAFQEIGNDHFLEKNGHNSTSSTDSNCLIQNSLEDDISSIRCFCTNNNVRDPNCSQSSSNSDYFSRKSLSPGVISEISEKLPALSSIREEDSVCGQTISAVNMVPIGDDNNGKKNDGRSIKNTDSERDKRPNKSHGSQLTKRVQFYFDEDLIEKVEGKTIAPKNGMRKSINKCKARKSVSNKKKNVSPKSATLKSNCLLPDNVSKLGKNSFLVTAEVHSPPNGIYAQEMKNKRCVSETMEPRVVLTDIFKSNKGLLSEMVGNGLRENRCMPKTITKTAAVPLATLPVNDLNTTYMDFESNAENRCLPEDIEIIECKDQRRGRGKIVSYKEPSLNTKMRRLL